MILGSFWGPKSMQNTIRNSFGTWIGERRGSRAPQDASRRPKTPRGLQVGADLAPRGVPKSIKNRSKFDLGRPRAPRPPQDPSKTPPRPPKTPQDTLKTPRWTPEWTPNRFPNRSQNRFNSCENFHGYIFMSKLKQGKFISATFVGLRAWAKSHGQELWPRASFCQTLIWNPLDHLTSLPLKEVGGRGGSL